MKSEVLDKPLCLYGERRVLSLFTEGSPQLNQMDDQRVIPDFAIKNHNAVY